jgi:hypothetical protein
MPPLNPRVEPLSGGGALLTWETCVGTGDAVQRQELCFAVRLEPARVQRLIAELGAERAIYLLWTHFRNIPATDVIDSERVSLQEWAQAVEALVAEVRRLRP